MIRINTLLGYENVLDIYYINKEGYVFSKKLNGKMHQGDNGKGYKTTGLKLKTERKWRKCYIHILVATAYIENTESKEQVNHKDENKGNNHVENLEWVTRSENMNHGTAMNRMKLKRCDKIYVYDYLLNFIGEYLGMAEATKKTIGYVDTGALNGRAKEYFYLNSNEDYINKIIEIAKDSEYKTVVVKNVNTNEKLYFPYNREARRFFDGKVNVTDAINKNWLVRKKYRIYNLDYSTFKKE